MADQLVLGKEFPFESIFRDIVFALLDIREKKEFVKDVGFTDNIIGYVYTVVELNDFIRFEVFVEQKKPLLTVEKLKETRDNDQKIYCEFAAGTVKAYQDYNSKVVRESIKASDVRFVETK